MPRLPYASGRLTIWWNSLLMVVAAGLIGSMIYLANAHQPSTGHDGFPRPLVSYAQITGNLWQSLWHRIVSHPFNAVATGIFLLAVCHTFLSTRILAWSRRLAQAHAFRKKEGLANPDSVHFGAGILHLLGEVEAIFGIWVVVLIVAITWFHGWQQAVNYLGHDLNYVEPMFVVVVMTLASTRPVLKLAELLMWKIANRFGGMLVAWWMTILTFGPMLGSLITEPAAMTIAAHLLANKFYDLKPSSSFKYATLGLLFVNTSIGGTLTNFAAPPILMVAEPWHWSTGAVAVQFGLKSIIAILAANGLYLWFFRHEMARLQTEYARIRSRREIQRKFVHRKILEAELEQTEFHVANALGFTNVFEEECQLIRSRVSAQALGQGDPVLSSSELDEEDITEAIYQRFEYIKQQGMRKTVPGLLPPDQRPTMRDPDWDNREDWVPFWAMLVHVLFLAWVVINAHHPVMFIGGFLFFLGFAQVTPQFQNRINLKPALMVGFFLAALVIHGGLQAWWIEPVLSSLSPHMLMITAIGLTSFNDNAAVTYLATLVPDLSASARYAIVAGAVTGGGLTVIANAPNPAGQSILRSYFPKGVSPIRLLLGALIPTIIAGLCFAFLRW